MLVLAGLTDPRVTYWEPAKWVARLRATRTGRSVLALRTHMDAGHGGPPGRFDNLKEVALIDAFAIAAAAATPEPPRASVPIPKFASIRRGLWANFGIERTLATLWILVPLLNPKFALGLAAKCVRTSGSRH